MRDGRREGLGVELTGDRAVPPRVETGWVAGRGEEEDAGWVPCDTAHVWSKRYTPPLAATQPTRSRQRSSPHKRTATQLPDTTGWATDTESTPVRISSLDIRLDHSPTLLVCCASWGQQGLITPTLYPATSESSTLANSQRGSGRPRP